MADERNLPHFEPSLIDYTILADGLRFYTNNGYPYHEVPWVVRPEAVNVTLPPGAEATRNQYGDLVGSGEQSLIELMMRGEHIQKACCITPCFRLEPAYDDLHHGYFMKLELFDTQATVPTLMAMVACASTFYEQYIPTNVVETGVNMYDIVDAHNGIELGSYGFRTWSEGTFTYGTGVALPRLSTVMAQAQGSKPGEPSQSTTYVPH